MTRFLLYAIAVAIGCATAVSTTGACNTGTGACPSASEVVPGGACSENELQCGYSLTTLNAACDGTQSTYDTSCTCTNGTWACPDGVECEGGAAGDQVGDEAGAGDEASAGEM